jgi:hypothetical protein
MYSLLHNSLMLYPRLRSGLVLAYQGAKDVPGAQPRRAPSGPNCHGVVRGLSTVLGPVPPMATKSESELLGENFEDIGSQMPGSPPREIQIMK